jgi:acetyl-CoA carboxylase beta subunit
MQEGAISLMQDGENFRRADAAGRSARALYQRAHRSHHGGVTASFAMLGDLNIAEPGA